MSNPIISCHRVKKTVRVGFETIPVLNDITFDIERNVITYVVGRSGSGKSTLLHLIGGLDTPTAGFILFNNKKVSSTNDSFAATYRNKNVGFVFQFFHLIPELTVMENVMLPGLIGGTNKSKIKGYAQELLNTIGLLDRAHHFPRGLSGGEMQRIALARAVLNSPDVVLCDEPTGNLDEDNANILYNLIATLNKKNGTTFCIVTHDEEYVRGCSRVFRLQGGTVRRERWD